MAMQDEIRELTVNLLQSTVNASLVTAVCVGTEQFLTRRLRRELTPADCHDVFVLAAAMLSLACLNLMASEGLEQFRRAQCGWSSTGQTTSSLRRLVS